MNKEPFKKLTLNKETLMRLQEEQLKSIMGAEQLMTDGGTNVCDWTTCGASVGGDCSNHVKVIEVEALNTCCKKSC